MKLILMFLLSLNPAQWYYSANVVVPIVQDGNGLYFDFPVGPDVDIDSGGKFFNYLMGHFNGSLSTAQALRITFRIDTSGAPVFGFHSETYNTCPNPAYVRFYFESRGWDRHIRSSDYRWYSNPTAYQLQSTAGTTVSLVVNLKPEQWSNVGGEPGASQVRQFESAKKSVDNIGLSFGGGCFFGHGVNVHDGTARFVLLGYEVL